MIPQVSILFAREDSIYKTLPGCDVWDIKRNALNWPGGHPVVAHPPCRGWCRLRNFAKPAPGELDLGPWAVSMVRRWGGVLEHPAGSSLWRHCGLPRPGRVDGFGGFCVSFPQWWFGHRAEKLTWFYIVGCSAESLPEVPLRLGRSAVVVDTSKRGMPRKWISHSERDRTPLPMALWLCQVARKCSKAARLEREFVRVTLRAHSTGNAGVQPVTAYGAESSSPLSLPCTLGPGENSLPPLRRLLLPSGRQSSRRSGGRGGAASGRYLDTLETSE